MRMSDDKFDFSDPELSRRFADNAYRTRDVSVQMVPVLTFSSPWPWVRAIMVSLLLWAGIAALIWRLF
jgi:hypothetical protein